MSDIMSFSPLWGVWEVIRPLGSGSFGDVYEVRRTEPGREYSAAVKHISIPPAGVSLQALRAEGYVTDVASARRYCQSLLDALTREIDLCYEVKGYTNFVGYEDHMVFPRASDIGYDVFIRMELLTGLPEYIDEKGISIGGISKLCGDMCAALEVLERKGIVHRDIKPANIFVNSTGDFKLGDFGVARHMEGLGGMSVKGTYNYMAPEILKGGAAGPGSDIYSLGLVLYRLLNHNRAPFLPPPPAPVSYQESQDALDRRLSGERLPLPARAELSPPLTNVIMCACEYDAAMRFRSARDMKRAFGELQSAVYQPAMSGAAPCSADTAVAVERGSPDPARYDAGAFAPQVSGGGSDGKRGGYAGACFSPYGGNAPPRKKRKKPLVIVLLALAGLTAALILAAAVIAALQADGAPGGSDHTPAPAQETPERTPDWGSSHLTPASAAAEQYGVFDDARRQGGEISDWRQQPICRT